MIGTPVYMAPELTTGASASPASDVYALGVTLYEAVTGTPPFDAEDPYSILYRHRHDPVPSLEVDPPELAGAIVQALAKDPAGRSDGTDALARTLRSIAVGRHAESLAPTVGALAPTGVPGVDTGPEPVDRPSPVDLPEAPAAAGPTGGGEDGGRRPGRAALAMAGCRGTRSRHRGRDIALRRRGSRRRGIAHGGDRGDRRDGGERNPVRPGRQHRTWRPWGARWSAPRRTSCSKAPRG